MPDLLVDTTAQRGAVASLRGRRAGGGGGGGVLYAIATRTARDIAPLSADPAAAEQVLLPGAMLKPLVVGRISPPGIEVELIEELATDVNATPLPWPSLDALGRDVEQRIAAAFAAPAVEIRTPGKFVGPSPEQACDRHSDGRKVRTALCFLRGAFCAGEFDESAPHGHPGSVSVRTPRRSRSWPPGAAPSPARGGR